MGNAQLITRVGDNSAGLSRDTLADLNRIYRSLSFAERIRRVYQDFAPDRIMVTSSFAATSAYFLHIISTIRPEQKVHFIDTGYHFQETLDYKDYLIKRFDLDVIDVTPDPQHHEVSQQERMWETDPDLCCQVNKVAPLEEAKENYDLWISSLMSWQTEHRAGLEIFEERRGMIKFNPMIDVTREERDAYIAEHDLPFHPLVKEGYHSIGCSHCTWKGEGREGRWQGKAKTECGIHL
ncbi:phosphoadenylyl-sulfate reductase [Alloalcanivorax xenomutans]|jgi:phosphoadenosine phosphosulfate reductase|uniref:Adenosine 5'-phosphosulfate reductase n=1 Tax=Alloalcanivorax xenomutans TaxID=1094342 RepID=A0A9Q3W7I8_9GAMM|nr:phosphoadenylyl-sulfate reductase [Alloalcanivorax xenomutans]ERS11072.1 2', 3'-cyclic nucleotide 2'-phosphodiesterase [Alcanivorax sp. PN-3]KYZ87194.1 2',3'-cyclic-nucleotide 2'-phosphodiesterase [Alcanivorax sp. KX64203]ARB45194.1 2', 3'-cyclic nucleotide 2'-phosphodiesterase [Alloalcanivorax xenomutans]MCE7510459.1 phosphoadenylyl-sulfate reductase [Alloalcanivorax xenomutans]MCE7525460.1 phosphoadenylyl-sulfate reductase [Alloalcanivorax xenomutans]|tara:strand:+ start:2228 stop:2938 length:711 start_codon:yes stop_codon:yes gene_type:complete